MATDFLKVLREVRGTGAPEAPYTDGIYWDITVKDYMGFPGIYGHMLHLYSTLGGSAAELGILSNHLAEILTVHADLDNIDAVALNISNVNTVAGDSLIINSVHNDRLIIGDVYGSLEAIDSLYADKITLDSIYADKITLDSLFNDKITLDTLFDWLPVIGTVNANTGLFQSVNDSVPEITIVADNIGVIHTVSEGMAAIIDSEANAFEALTSQNAAATSAALADGRALDSFNSSNSAELYASNAFNSQVESEVSENLAEEWAENPENVAISTVPGAFSSLHHATKALASAVQSANSESIAGTYAAAALTSQNTTAADAITTAAARDAAISAQGISQAARDEAVDAKDFAQAAEANAAAIQVIVENMYDSYDDRYLGSFTDVTEPLLDNDGDPLLIGATYWNSDTNVVKFYNGLMWEDPALSTSQSALNASASQIAAAASAALANASAVITTADKAVTNANVVITNADVVTTNANASAASISAVNADSDAEASSTSALASLASSNSANSSADLAAEWAENEPNVSISNLPTSYSALHYSTASAAFSVASAASAVSSATSETNTATSEANALTSETNAAASEAASLVSQNASAVSAAAALVSENASSVSETNSGTSETNAATSEGNALTSETNADISENMAEEWANNNENFAVTGNPGQFSSKHHAIKSAASAVTSTGAAASAVISEANALASENTAAVSESVVLASQAVTTTAATTATNAATSATASELASAISETNSANSETAAASSASAASNSSISAAFSEANSDTSEANALTSENNASDSEGLAQEWASKIENSTITGNPGLFSSLHYAAKSSASAAASLASENTVATNTATVAANTATAVTSAANAATSESNALSSELAAASSAMASSTSASSATASQTASAISAANALVSENNAGASEDSAFADAVLAAASEAAADLDRIAAAASAASAAISETNAGASATSASLDAGSATASASLAVASAAAALSSEGVALTSETEAVTAAFASETAQGIAETARDEAVASADLMDDLFLGAKVSDPLSDNDGDLLQEGAIFYNTTDNQLKIWNGTLWDPAVFNATDAVLLFNGRNGNVTLTFSDIEAALGYNLYEYTSIEKTKLDSIEVGATADQLASEVLMGNVVGSPTYAANIEEQNSLVNSSGVIAGGDLIDHLNGTVTIESSTTFLRSAPDVLSTLYVVEVPEYVNLTFVDGVVNYVFAFWNGGVPIYGSTIVQGEINCEDKCLAYIVHRDGNELHIIDDRQHSIDVSKKVRAVFRSFSYFIHSGAGSVLSEPAALALAVTAGEFYYTVTKLPHPAFDTSVAGTATANTFSLSYRDGIGGWLTDIEQKVIDTTIYDDGTGVPVAILGNNNYGVSWIYMVHNKEGGDLHVLMGQEEYPTQADAENASLPSELPTLISGLGSLIGFIVYEKAATTFNNVLSAFTQSFTSSTASSHNALSGLQGGEGGEYYHVTAAQISEFNSFGDALDGKVDDFQVLTNVPIGAVFTDTDTDTIYTHPAEHSISEITGLTGELSDKLPLAGGTITGNIITAGADIQMGVAFDGITNPNGSDVLRTSTADGSNATVIGNIFGTTYLDSLTIPKIRVSGQAEGSIWHSANDGAGSGLDADLLDGQHAASFAPVSHGHAISEVSNLQNELNAKANSFQVLTDVPVGAVFTDTLTTITNNLISISTTAALSANQGKVLKDLIDGINSILSSSDTTLDEMQEIVDYIKANKSTLDSLSIANIAGLQGALDAKIDDSQVLTNVPLGALFTDTVYSDTAIQATVALNTAKITYPAVDSTKLAGIAVNANNYVHPTHAGDDISIDTGTLSGATVISDIDFNVTTDTEGHVTDATLTTLTTRNLTVDDIGASNKPTDHVVDNVEYSPVWENNSGRLFTSTADLKYNPAQKRMTIGTARATVGLELGPTAEASIEYNAVDNSIDFIIN